MITRRRISLACGIGALVAHPLSRGATAAPIRRVGYSGATLLSYATDLATQWRYAAKWVDKILKGAKPADLPVEQPIKFELVINLKTTKALGLKIPQTVLLRTDEVID